MTPLFGLRSSLLAVLASIIMLAAASAPADVVLEWVFDTPGDSMGWTAQKDAEGMEVRDGAVAFRVTGPDPVFLSPAFDLRAAEARYLHVRAASDLPAGEAELFWSQGPDGPFAPNRRMPFMLTPSSTEMKDYYVDLGASPAWQGRIRSVRFDPEKNRQGGSIRIERIGFLSALPDGAELRSGPALRPAENRTHNAFGWYFNTGERAPQWLAKQDIGRSSQEGGVLRLEITGNDPQLVTEFQPLQTERYPVLRIRYRTTTVNGDAELRWRAPGERGFPASRVAVLKLRPNTNEFEEYLLELGAMPEWTGAFEALRFDPDTRSPGGTFEIDLLELMPHDASGVQPPIAPLR